MVIKGRIISQNTPRITVDFKAFLCAFEGEGAVSVLNYPMERGEGKLVAEGNVD